MGKRKYKYEIPDELDKEIQREMGKHSVKELTDEQVDELIHRAESGKLRSEDVEIIRWGFKTLSWLYRLLEFKNISLSRLRKLLFGSRSEKTRKIFKDGSEGNQIDDEDPDNEVECEVEDKEDRSESREDSSNEEKKKRKGHGRNGAKDYPGAEIKEILHGSLKPGDKCPECIKGKLYDFNRPRLVLRIRGSAPIKAIIFKLQRLRCSSCMMLFTAELPAEAGEEKYDAESGTMIALLKYGNGFPFYRLGKFQSDQGIPLPPGTQWDVIKSVFAKIFPVFEVLENLASQGDVLHNDDTGAKILSIIKEREKARENGEKGEERTGTFTSGILSKVDGHRIALYYSGRDHAGENLDNLLDHRPSELDPPIHMSDALKQNETKRNKTRDVNCLSHGRRKFVDLVKIFPDECREVLEKLRVVYKNDKKAKKKKMTGRQRLLYHQEKSGPVMEELEQWLKDQIENNKVEENSSLGEAINYMLNHWDKLTGFLRIEKAPLDNNILERCLKRFILSRKNSYFYRTEYGAFVGGVFMSIIETCHLEDVNPFRYITALQKYSNHVRGDPEKWLPWNYQETVARLSASSGYP